MMKPGFPLTLVALGMASLACGCNGSDPTPVIPGPTTLPPQESAPYQMDPDNQATPNSQPGAMPTGDPTQSESEATGSLQSSGGLDSFQTPESMNNLQTPESVESFQTPAAFSEQDVQATDLPEPTVPELPSNDALAPNDSSGPN